MVVLRSTTPCVAVSSFNNSVLFTVISIAASRLCVAQEGMNDVLSEYWYYLYQKKITKHSSSSRCLMKSGIALNPFIIMLIGVLLRAIHVRRSAPCDYNRDAEKLSSGSSTVSTGLPHRSTSETCLNCGKPRNQNQLLSVSVSLLSSRLRSLSPWR